MSIIPNSLSLVIISFLNTYIAIVIVMLGINNVSIKFNCVDIKAIIEAHNMQAYITPITLELISTLASIFSLISFINMTTIAYIIQIKTPITITMLNLNALI